MQGGGRLNTETKCFTLRNNSLWRYLEVFFTKTYISSTLYIHVQSTAFYNTAWCFHPPNTHRILLILWIYLPIKKAIDTVNKEYFLSHTITYTQLHVGPLFIKPHFFLHSIYLRRVFEIQVASSSSAPGDDKSPPITNLKITIRRKNIECAIQKLSSVW